MGGLLEHLKASEGRARRYDSCSFSCSPWPRATTRALGQGNSAASEPEQSFPDQKSGGDIAKQRSRYRKPRAHQAIDQKQCAQYHSQLTDLHAKIETQQQLAQAVTRELHFQ